MNWIKIERDKDGFATDDCLEEIEELYGRGIPVVVFNDGCGKIYEVLQEGFDVKKWLSDIRISEKFTHYLPIPKIQEL